jgi:hypothetical protein
MEDSRNQVSEQAQPELQFVTLTGPPSSRSGGTRMIVRSHAMQSFLREKRPDGSVPVRTEPKVPLKGINEGAGRFKLASWSRKSGRKLSSAASLVQTTTNSASTEAGGNKGATRVSLGNPAFKHVVRKAK